ncbi:MFS transporter [Solirubrobacter sp. CPCC 204708]|uniref:MFS transporter n=1 Tax=Solirubrobacter deserti TaxID=2282478 RepID=A0ABT4RRA2_9ACTN|nr:MFS transporter [Solirubrobacter deserti]MBE2314872.1 MFS transporter [Solirubrobacter deserti]MDA0141099.1 MFS transporter [Solirubrobacter deserti]
MTAIPAGRAAAREGWFAALGVKGRRAFRAAYAGYMLDAFDLIVLTLSLTAIGATFSVGTGATGALSTVTLSASAIGGVLGGVLADRIGRARTLMLSVGVYSLFTFLSGLATSYEMLMVFRVFQGIGFGAEWGVGAVLVAELVRPEARGKALGVIQSAWAAGWALAVIAYLISFELFAESTAWRVLMCLGILPAVLILYVRSRVEDPEVFREAEKPDVVPLKQILSGSLLKTTVAASVLATGIQGGYYAMFTWIPTYLKEERDLTIVGTSGYLFVVIAGAFLGYLSAGFVHDRIGRRRAFALFALLAGASLVLYFTVPSGSNTTLLLVGFPLGFFASGCFSGFGSYLSELFPTHARATGGGFCYNVGRGIGALFPGVIGFLAAAIGLGGAIAFGVFGYVLAICALLVLPETAGRDIAR